MVNRPVAFETGHLHCYKALSGWYCYPGNKTFYQVEELIIDEVKVPEQLTESDLRFLNFTADFSVGSDEISCTPKHSSKMKCKVVRVFGQPLPNMICHTEQLKFSVSRRRN